MVFLSVLIPIYNTNLNYLDECLKSILKNKFDDVEIILINDGSNEETINFINDYKLDDRFKIVNNQINIGVSKSFNKYIQICNGEYITFIDSDDMIEINMFETFYNYADKFNKPDMIKSISYLEHTNNKFQKHTHNNLINYVNQIYNKNKIDLLFKYHDDISYWTGIYRTKIVKSIKWNEYVKNDCQDLGFLYNFIFSLDTYVLIDNITYIYRLYSDQDSKKKPDPMNIITEYKNILNYISTNDEEILITFYTRLIISFVYTLGRKPNNPELIIKQIIEFPLKYFKYIDRRYLLSFLNYSFLNKF